MTPTAPRRPPLGGGTYPWPGDDRRPRSPVSTGPPPRGTPKLSPLVYGGTNQAWAGEPSDDATRRLFLSCLALLSAAAGVIHFAAAIPHFDESALHGAFFVGTGLAQLAGAGLLVAWPRKPVLMATAVGDGLILALWVMSRTAGVPVGPHVWTPEPIGIADSVAALLEAGLVAGSVLLMAPSSTSLVAKARPREPKWWLAGAASVAVLITVLALPSAARPGGHSHASTSEGSSESEASTSRATESVGQAAASRPQPVDQTTKAVTAPPVQTSPAPVYQPPAPTTVRNPAPVYQPPPAVVVPEPAPDYQPPAPVIEPPKVEPQREPAPTHTHEGGEHHEHSG